MRGTGASGRICDWNRHGRSTLVCGAVASIETGVAVDYIRSTAEALAEKHAGEFAVVTCLEMLEHVPDPSTVIKPARTYVNQVETCSSPP